MGLLDDLLGQLGGGAGMAPRPQPRSQPQPQPASLGGNAGMGRIVMALLPVVLAMLAKRGGQGQLGSGRSGGTGGGGGLGDVLGGMLGGGSGSGGGGLGDVLGGMLGGGSGAARGGTGGGGLADVLGGVLGGGSGGGLGGLLEGFQRAGLGQQAQSWVSTGANEEIPPAAIEEVFGPGGVGQIARAAGLTEQETKLGLSQILPEVVDKVTPTGEIPDDNSLADSVDALVRRLQAAGALEA